jgi:hypothetical protein
MGPCMGCNMVPSGVHTLDKSGPRVRGIINLTFSKIVSGDEKGCFGIVLIQQVENVRCVNIWSIVIRQGNLSLILQLVSEVISLGYE